MRLLAGKRRGYLLTLLIALVVFAAVSLFFEYYIPAKAADLIAEQLKTEYGIAQKPRIVISAHPLLYKIITGTIDDISLQAVDVKLPDKPEISKVDAEVKGIHFNLLELVKTRQQTAIKRIDEGSARIVLSEKAVNEAMADRLAGSKIKLEEDGLWYISSLPYIGFGATLNIPGDIAVQSDNVVTFKPDMERISLLALNQEEKDYLADALSVSYRLEDMPEGVTLEKITVERGRLIADCKLTGMNLLKMGDL